MLRSKMTCYLCPPAQGRQHLLGVHVDVGVALLRQRHVDAGAGRRLQWPCRHALLLLMGLLILQRRLETCCPTVPGICSSGAHQQLSHPGGSLLFMCTVAGLALLPLPTRPTHRQAQRHRVARLHLDQAQLLCRHKQGGRAAGTRQWTYLAVARLPAGK